LQRHCQCGARCHGV